MLIEGGYLGNKLYLQDTSLPTSPRLVPTLKYEYVYLMPFSKMRVDLAAQVHWVKSAYMSCFSRILNMHVCMDKLWGLLMLFKLYIIEMSLIIKGMSETVANALERTGGGRGHWNNQICPDDRPFFWLHKCNQLFKWNTEEVISATI